MKIRQELDRLFAGAPQTRAALELQEELLANCMDRYQDLVKGGSESDAAVQQVLGSIGNVDELIASLPEGDGVLGSAWEAQRRRNSAVVTTVAIGLYIFAGVVFLVGAFVGAYAWEPAILLGLIVAGLVCIVPTCMLVYSAHRWPKYQKNDESVVENFKQWSRNAEKARAVRRSISLLLWTLAVVVYLAVSFLTFAWWITWIIFPVALCVESLVTLFFKLKEM